MKPTDMLKREVVEIGGRKFAISAIPCDPAHEIWTDCVKAMDGKVTPFAFSYLPLDIVKRILEFVAVDEGKGEWKTLDIDEVRGSSVVGESVLQQVVLAMAKKNFGFFFDGSLFLWLEAMAAKPA